MSNSHHAVNSGCRGFHEQKMGKGVGFERIRRITGYLVGSLDTWNNAKKAEENDRVKHGIGEELSHNRVKHSIGGGRHGAV